MTKKINGLTFEQWYQRADAVVVSIAGVGIDDLSDGMSADAWRDGLTPREYALDQLESEGFPF